MNSNYGFSECEEYDCLETLTLGDHLRNWVKKYHDRIALVEKDKKLTFFELDKKADELASGFLSMGIKKNDNVVLQLPNSISFVIVFFALSRIGAVPVLSMPAHRESELDAIFSIAEPVAYIIPEIFLGFDYVKMADKLIQKHSCVKSVIIDSNTETNKFCLSDIGRPVVDIADPPLCQDTALLLLSGGTTGTPKLIPRTHRDYAYNAKESAVRCKLDQDSVYLAVLPVAHNFPLSCPGVIGTLSAGGKVVLSKTASFDEAFPLIEREKVTITALVPAMVNLWLQALEWNSDDISSIEVVQIGGSPLDENLARRIVSEMKCKLQQVFGMAEGLLCYTSLDDSDHIIFGCQGKPLSIYDEIRIVDENGTDVQKGEFGELLVRGPYTIKGYFRAPEQNLRDFTPEGFYRSGDKARITTDGNIQVKGRIKDQINRAGEKIMSAEIESYLNSHPDIEDSSIVAVPDDNLGERSCAFIIASSPGIKLAGIHGYLENIGVARYKMPDQLEFITCWPLTSVGKVDKKKLAKMASEKEKTASNSYLETLLKFDGDPLFTACQIIESGFFKDYLFYENRDECSLGLDIYALLTVDSRKTEVEIDKKTYFFENGDLGETIHKAFSIIPLNDWRAYGTANFELSGYNYKIDLHKGENRLLKQFIPETEVRFTRNSILLRSLKKNGLEKIQDIVNSILNKNQEESIKTDLKERIERQKLDIPEISTYNSENYKKIVACAVEEIREPQYQKVILSRKIPLNREIDMIASYMAGRMVNTPARSFLLKIEDLKAAGFSPETVVEVDGNRMVSTQPLAGTRSTGSDYNDEIRLKEELVNSSKEIAEHAISVKLAFEEMLQVCDSGTVSLSEFMAVARRGNVQHLASRLKGKLKEKYNSWHAFNALFPAVTATGIPKRESIEAIGRFETEPRNLYSGCVMIYDSNGKMDAALVLRSFFQKDENAWLHAGAGIVDMSEPARELEETCEKLRSVSSQIVCI